MEQQFVALSVRPCRPLEPAVQQRDGLGLLAFADQQSTELGTGVGIAGVGGQFALHGLSQPRGLVAAGQQSRAIAVVQDRRLRTIHNPPLGFTVQQCIDAVVDHGVIRPAPTEIGMAAEQTADPGVGRHGGTQFVAQQVDHQHVRLSHQLTQLGDDLRLQPFVGIQHQHPIAVEKRQGAVAGGCEIARPIEPFHTGPGSSCHRNGGVGGTGVHHHHFVGEALHRSQAVRQPRFFVAHDHRQAEHCWSRNWAGG